MLVSGGATAALLPVFFLLPISVAFQDRPLLTGALGLFAAVGYLAAWIVYSKRDDPVGFPDIVYTQFGFLLWLAVAMTALCFFLARGQARVLALLEVRSQLVAEAMRADERHNREIAETPARRAAAESAGRAPGGRRIRERSPIRRWTPSTTPCRRPRPGCAPPSPSCTRRCSRSWAWRLRCGNCCASSPTRGDYEVIADLEDVGKPGRRPCCTARRVNCWPTSTSTPAPPR